MLRSGVGWRETKRINEDLAIFFSLPIALLPIKPFCQRPHRIDNLKRMSADVKPDFHVPFLDIVHWSGSPLSDGIMVEFSL
jgi:hypothetical protein